MRGYEAGNRRRRGSESLMALMVPLIALIPAPRPLRRWRYGGGSVASVAPSVISVIMLWR